MQKLTQILYVVKICCTIDEKLRGCKNMKTNVVEKMMKVMNCLAVMLVAQTANAACIWIFHQPEFPQEAKKYSKIK